MHELPHGLKVGSQWIWRGNWYTVTGIMGRTVVLSENGSDLHFSQTMNPLTGRWAEPMRWRDSA